MEGDLSELSESKEWSPMGGTVAAVCRGAEHTFGQSAREVIRLLAGLGVEGDAHAGERVRHRSRVRRDPARPDLRQVHLIHEELHAELRGRGFDVGPGEPGENITTRGGYLPGPSAGAVLRIGPEAVVEGTGLRNPCLPDRRLPEGGAGRGSGPGRRGAVVREAGVDGGRALRRRGAARRRDLGRAPSGPHRPLEVV
ncbi:hypothetical protein HNR23_001902 [Nocardiopsis mwathae]|uniref:MOSC domain-containing protein n=1 Tax=Nocardiopsis mwathae TaxID=1472723 RepID=A0A7X0D4Z7_9ACTN|nr:hypothetical protein [Nocardiopsis mwathae]